jgi:hypothetical protein
VRLIEEDLININYTSISLPVLDISETGASTTGATDLHDS